MSFDARHTASCENDNAYVSQWHLFHPDSTANKFSLLIPFLPLHDVKSIKVWALHVVVKYLRHRRYYQMR
jgi:hypothetical protein